MVLQNYWEQADWQTLEAWIDAKNAGTLAADDFLQISHHYWEDIRKRIWLLWFPNAGTFFEDGQDRFNPDSKHYKNKEYQTFGTLPDANAGNLQYTAGEWKVTWFDEDYGWLWWTNKVDLTLGQTAVYRPPPSKIHPSDNVWVTEDGYWHLEADFNQYHQWDASSPFAYHYGAFKSLSTGSPSEEVYRLQNSCDRPAHYWLPKHVDPKFQDPIVWFTDKNLWFVNIKDKVAFDRLWITQPFTLGHLWSVERFGIIGFTDADNDQELVDPHGPMVQFNPSSGYQYSVRRGSLYGNSCGGGPFPGITKNDPTRQPRTGAQGQAEYPFGHGEWTFNPKNNWAYQNQAELVLSSVAFHNRASSIYATNFADFYGVSEADKSSHSSWYDYPVMWDHLWAENESSFELVCLLSEKYDHYFSESDPYKPSYLLEKLLDNLGVDTPTGWTETQHREAADLVDDFKGTWRRTWKHSMGRVSSWMRSYEMGEPDRQRGGWNPVTPYNTEKFYGSFARTFPLINEFDNIFHSIHSMPWQKAIIILGDLRESIKVGYMIHYCNSETDPISRGGAVLPNNFVRSIQYVPEDREKHIYEHTIIGLVRQIDGFSKIAWNKEICERHDPVEIEGDNYIITEGHWSEVTYVLKPLTGDEEGVPVTLRTQTEGTISGDDKEVWEKVAPILFEIKEKLVLPQWRGAELSATTKKHVWAHHPTDEPATAELSNDAHMAEMLAYYYAARPDNPDDWASSGLDIEYQVGIRRIISASPPPAWTWDALGAPIGHGIMESALHLTGDDELVSILQGAALVRMKGFDVYNDSSITTGTLSTTNHPMRGSTIGVGNATFTNIDSGSGSANKGTTFSYFQALLPVITHGATNKRWAHVYFKEPPKKLFWSSTAANIVTYAGGYQHWLTIQTDAYSLPIDMDKHPKEIWAYNPIGHVDASPAYQIGDTNPPEPNPPVQHVQAKAKFNYDRPAGGGEGGNFQFLISGSVGLCQDIENSNPVHYRGVDELGIRTSPYLQSRDWFYLHKVLTWQEAMKESFVGITSATTNTSGTITRFPCTNGDGVTMIFKTDDEVKIKGTATSNGIHTLVGADHTYIEIDKGGYDQETPAEGKVRHNVIGYGQTEWGLESAINNSKWGVQTRDSASPLPNESKVSKFKVVSAPEKYPWEIYAEDLEKSNTIEGGYI